MSRLDLTLDPKAPAARRIEVITGAVGRRRWSDEEKARAMEESLAPDAVVSQVARRHGATPQQLFTWRREALRKAAESRRPSCRRSWKAASRPSALRRAPDGGNVSRGRHGDRGRRRACVDLARRGHRHGDGDFARAETASRAK